jgi:hypothetical protein
MNILFNNICNNISLYRQISQFGQVKTMYSGIGRGGSVDTSDCSLKAPGQGAGAGGKKVVSIAGAGAGAGAVVGSGNMASGSASLASSMTVNSR